MKNVQILLLAILSMAYSHAQNRQLLYDFYEIPQSIMLNPGVKTPQKWHIGLPVASNITFYAGSSGLAVNDLFADDGIDFTTKVRDNAVNGLNFRDNITAGGTIEVFSAGFRTSNNPKNYYSFGVYGEGFFLNYWPEDLARLAFEGNANNIGRRFELNHLATQIEAVNVFHFGINRKINNKWLVGARAKIYSSVFELKSTNNDGYFVTTQGQDNILRNTIVADVEVRTSGVESLFDALDDDVAQSQELPRWLLGRSLFGGNLGLGFDLGFTHELSPNTYITASLQDIGFIYHNNDVKNYTLNGAASNEGVEIRLPEDLNNASTEFWQDLVDDLETLVPFETNTNSYFSLRPTKLNASIRKNWGERGFSSKNCECSTSAISQRSNDLDYVNAAGAQLFMINRPRGPQSALTAFYQRRIGNFMAVKTTYTADKYSLANVGLGVNFQLGPVNLYLLGDNLLGYQNIAGMHYASFQFGLNIISWNDY
ncbi:DUF5723 family protein [Croceivirga thetidis]|uniref:DUF5723 domain-containing protein n=1 Tax=Croceivirga thetidis TaxID=2721623 RepID=A0ABX1GUC9_9FLAO|nr:DUF5723 family protein [Croceivirga thetidis]NKI33244.1 hypothetical protein [Croceivirga thetidis]